MGILSLSALCLENAVQSVVGCSMKRNKLSIFTALVAALSMTSCYHEFPNGGGGGGGGATTANVSVTMFSDTAPASIGIMSFVVTVNAIELTSSSGTQTTFAPNSGKGITVDLARVQSDSAFLGTIPNVPTGTLSSISLSFAPTVELAFFNGTGAAVTNLNPACPANDLCAASFTVVGAPSITSTQSISGNTGIGIDVNLANALTLSGTTLTPNLSNSGNTNVVSAVALPRANTSLAAGQLDLIEDFTGAVSVVSGTNVTIASPSLAGRGSIVASSVAGTTVYDQDPTQTLCPGGTTSLGGCVTANGAASMDAILNTDGTFTVQEIEPLQSTLQDTVEGIVVLSTSATQFDMIVTDIIPAATSNISGVTLGTPMAVNLLAGPNFWVDTKGLAVGAAISNFQGMTDTSALHPGQAVAVHIVAMAAPVANQIPSATTDTVTLRWSRFISTVQTASSPAFSVTAIPGYFGFTPASISQIQTYVGTQGAEGITNLDGITGGAGATTANLTGSGPVAIRALLIEDTGNTLQPAFYAAKVRQP